MRRHSTSETNAGRGRRQFGGLLWQQSFRLMWIGETVNQFGSAMAVVGVPLLVVLVLHASTFAVGALTAAAYLPWLIIGLPAGAWVDRLPPRTVMIICDVISAGLYASIPIAVWVGVLTIGQGARTPPCACGHSSAAFPGGGHGPGLVGELTSLVLARTLRERRPADAGGQRRI